MEASDMQKVCTLISVISAVCSLLAAWASQVMFKRTKKIVDQFNKELH